MSATDTKVLIMVQDFAVAKALSEPAFATVNILGQRKLLTSSDVNLAFAWINFRGGKFGTGIVFGMPFIEDERKETGISDSTIVLPIHCFEHPDSAQKAATGSRITAEELVMAVRKMFRGFVIDGVASFFTEGRSISPSAVSDPNSPNNFLSDVIAYELHLRGRLRSPTEQRTEVPTISETSLEVTLTGPTDSDVYFTIDGTSFPGAGDVNTQGSNLVPADSVFDEAGNYSVTVTPGARYVTLDALGNPTAFIAVSDTNTLIGEVGAAVAAQVFPAAAQIYSDPFTVTSGTVIFFAAYLAGKSGSNVIQRTIT